MRKAISPSLLFMFLVALPGKALAGSAAPLTFGEAVKRTRAASVDAARIENSVKQAELERSQIDKKNDPKATAAASLGGKYTPSEPWASPAPSSRGAPQPWGSMDGNLSLQLSQTLYDFGRQDAEKSKSDLLVKAKAAELSQVDEAAQWKAAKAFSRVLAADAVVRLARDQLAIAETKRKNLAENFSKGLRSENDISRADVDLGRARLNARRAEDDLHQARIQLAMTMGDRTENADVDFPIAGSQQKSGEQWRALLASWKSAESIAADSIRRAQKSANDAELTAIEKRLYPTITGSTSLAFMASQPLPNGLEKTWKTTLGAQIGLSWDIPWNGAYRDDQTKVALKDREIDLAGEAEARQREEKAVTARGLIEILLGQLTLVEAQARLVERNAGLVRKKYEAGKATASELSSAEDEWVSIRSDLVKTNNSVAAAALDLGESLGIHNIETFFQH